MEIYPAIDLRGGQVVRLTQGDYDRMEVYATDPAAVAAAFRDRGARNLHMVDLDGARDGTTPNREAIRRAATHSGLFVQVGGGIRDEARVAQYLEMGVGRVILGTVAVENFAFVEAMVQRYGDKIAVGVDARDGRVAVKGWRELTDVDALEFCGRLAGAGVATIIFTDISRDGMGEGANLELYRVLAKEVGSNIIASGGVTYAGEIGALKETGVHGAIVGKALYTGALTLEEVLSLC